MHLSDIFWPILGILGKNVLIFDEFLRFNRKISTLNNARVKKGNIGDFPNFNSFRLASLLAVCSC